MSDRTRLQRKAIGIVRITEAQIDFAVDLDNRFGALFPDFPPYFLQSVDAIDRDDPADFGKFCALLIIEISKRGELIAHEAARWIELFGKLPEFDLFDGNSQSVTA